MARIPQGNVPMELLERVVDAVGAVLDALGLLIIAAGVVRAGVRALRAGGSADDPYRRLRHDLGKGILLGLEFLVAADIIRTVAVKPNMEEVQVLALVVAIRTFLSLALEVELEGKWPWRRAAP